MTHGLLWGPLMGFKGLINSLQLYAKLAGMWIAFIWFPKWFVTPCPKREISLKLAIRRSLLWRVISFPLQLTARSLASDPLFYQNSRTLTLISQNPVNIVLTYLTWLLSLPTLSWYLLITVPSISIVAPCTTLFYLCIICPICLGYKLV